MGTVYRPIGLEPNNETRDMTEAQIFTGVVQNTTTDYQVRIYDLSDNTLLYDSGKVTDSYYATETLSVTIPITPAIATVRELKWTLEIFNGADSVLSREIPFTNYEPPTVNLSSTPATITEQSYEFEITYSHPQSIEPISYEIELYDSTDELIRTSGVINNASLRYTFENFLDNTVYKVKGYVTDANNIEVETSLTQFAVDYLEPSLTFSPTVENKPEVGGIEIKWGGAYSITGSATGDYRYIENFVEEDNYGVQLDSGAYIRWEDVDIGDDNVTMILFQPNTASFDGDIVKYTNTDTNVYLSLGYDYSQTKFYREQGGIRQYTEDFELGTSSVYLLYWSSEYLKLTVYPKDISWEEADITWSTATFTWENPPTPWEL